ncbi:hypothetical protein KUCAC02_017005 [Chaenocephalus aceratus]|nr:hypothetical protein KUCAC02_017005 [Chaenocephalus aceratus]
MRSDPVAMWRWSSVSNLGFLSLHHLTSAGVSRCHHRYLRLRAASGGRRLLLEVQAAWNYSSKTTTTSPKSSESKRIYLESGIGFFTKVDGIQSPKAVEETLRQDSDIILKRDGNFCKKAP